MFVVWFGVGERVAEVMRRTARVGGGGLGVWARAALVGGAAG